MAAPARTDLTDAPGRAGRLRGPGRHPLWRRPGEVSVIVLPLVVRGTGERRRLDKLFAAMHAIKRALQREARNRLRAYWAGTSRLQRDAGRWREELGLSRDHLERCAYRHLERSGWLLGHVSKALAMHQADEVWAGVERHLFGDGAGRRSGLPRIGGYWDYRRIAGRARSHTTERKWETFRLFGSLDGHLAARRHRGLPAAVTAAAEAARLEPGTRVLAQSRCQRPPERPSSWWDYRGPLVVVFNGGPRSRAGELVLPVRLPQGAGRWPHLLHFLGRPERWHKVDLVRRRDASAVGGWAYEAHLMVLGEGYRSPATRARREAAAGLERVGGVDGNVSNLAVVSFPGSCSPADGEVASTRVVLSEAEQARLARERRQARGRQRALDRSRRAGNRQQYELSRRQRRRAERRAWSGLADRQVGVPGGARVADAGGRPRQRYRDDALSAGYRRIRGVQAEAAAGQARARGQRAERQAAALVAVHGPHLRIEDVSVAAWFRRWGRACAAFSPGRLIRALERECAACGGALLRVGTAHTALSQHCLCGARVTKTLGQRTHTCPECGLAGDRDLISAALAAFTELDDHHHPASARVDYDRARLARRAYGQRLQAAVAESTVLRPRAGATAARQTSPGRGGRAAARRIPVTGPCRPRLGASSRRREVTAQARLPNGQNFWDVA